MMPDTGEYRSNRWFYITAKNRTLKGFVHSSRVAAQTKGVPECGTQRGITVTRWTAEHYGVTDPTSSERSTAGIPVGNYWSGYCAGFACDAYQLGFGTKPSILGPQTAKAWYDAYHAAKKTAAYSETTNVGSLIFWRAIVVKGVDVTGGAGHVAVYVGNGQVLTTQGLPGQRLPITRKSISSYPTAPSGEVPQPYV